MVNVPKHHWAVYFEKVNILKCELYLILKEKNKIQRFYTKALKYVSREAPEIPQDFLLERLLSLCMYWATPAVGYTEEISQLIRLSHCSVLD